MVKGRYNISVLGDSNLKKRGNNNDETELENQECANSCLSPAFLRSWSFHDRPRSSRLSTIKELDKSRYKALSSTSLEAIPTSSLTISFENEYSAHSNFEYRKIDEKVETIAQLKNDESSISYEQIEQNQLPGAYSCMDDRDRKFCLESEKLLERSITILRTVDKDITQSLLNLSKSESIALKSIIETYKNKGNSPSDYFVPSEFDSKKSFSHHKYENWQPPFQHASKDFHIHSTPRGPNDFQVQFSQQNSQLVEDQPPQQFAKDLQTQSPCQSLKNSEAHSAQQSSKTFEPQINRQSLKNLLAHSALRSPKNLPSQSPNQSPNNSQVHSAQLSPKNQVGQSPRQSLMNLPAHSTQQSPKNQFGPSPRQSPKNSPAHSTQQTPGSMLGQSPLQSPKSLQTDFAKQNPKNFLIQSAKQTLKNLECLLSSNSESTQPLAKTDSCNAQHEEQNPTNVRTLSKMNISDDPSSAKSSIEFGLPTDHEQLMEMIEALQSRCLEYREMIQDVAVMALEECLNFSEFSLGQIRQLREQFRSQKKNFRDFKELCCKSVVFGHDSLPIDEKVAELIQSFYLKLLQEENETFIARLEFGLKMGEMYAKMLKFELESKQMIKTLEDEILYLKKTSIGFKV